MKIKLNTFRDDLIKPTRAHYNDAGIDCYAQDDFCLTGFDQGANTKVVELGFGLEIPDGYMATIRPRSSVNLKGIITQLGTIDSGYRGEIKVIFLNPTEEYWRVGRGDKICQIVIEPVILADFVEELVNDRGTGGFGSTGR